jgi:hypothetical protein
MRNIFVLGVVGFAATALLPVSLSLAASAPSGTSAATLDVFGRRGADDPKGHIRGEGVGHPVKADDSFTVARRGRGADDPKGHIRGEGVGHPVKSTINTFTVA